MLYEGNLRLQNKKKANIQVDDFAGGVNTLFSATRLKKNEAYEATNLILIEDGVWDKRWGTQIYPIAGTTFTNRPDGFCEYRKTDGTRELIVVADGVVIRVSEDGTKTTISGATFTQGTPVEFLQINNYLYICNGIDDLARYDGSTLATYTALAAPAWAGTPLARGGGLSAGSFTYYYRVTAVNSVGETTPNAEQSITANIARADWDAANESITLDWDAVSGALKYIVYFSDTSGFEVKLAEVEGGSTGYIDLGGGGVDIPNPYVEPPTDNTTDGPKFSTIALSGNRIWGAKNPDAPWRVYFSGTGVNLGNFSPAYGGGWIDLEKGGRATTEKPVDYQGKAHILCKTDDGKGTIWQISLDSISIDTETFTVPIPTKIITSIGTPAPRSVIYVENDVMFFNPKGVHVLGNEPGVLNVLRTNELTAKIRPYIRGLNAASLDKICAYYFNSKVLFAVPSGEGYPDRIIMFDRERVSWIKDWTVGVSQFGEYTDSNGVTHLLGIGEDRLVEFSPNFSGDDGTAFSWRYTSPRFPVAEDWSEFARIKRAIARLRNVTGSIDLTVLGTGKTQQFSTLTTAVIESESSGSGIGWDQLGDFQLGDSNGYPTAFAEESLIRYMVINKLIRDIQIQISADELQDRAVILGYIIEGFRDQTAKPLSWQLSN